LDGVASLYLDHGWALGEAWVPGLLWVSDLVWVPPSPLFGGGGVWVGLGGCLGVKF
jgi:hypothetical protein